MATAKKAKSKRARKPKAEPAAENQPVMIGYKGFDKNLQCRGYQYEVGKTHEVESASLCDHGLHFCENPMDVFGYYPPANGELNRFAVVEASGVDEEVANDSKRVATQLKVTAEIGLPGLIKAGVEYIIAKATETSAEEGDQSAATNTGDQSAATNTGNQSAATNTGDQSAATNTGNQSAATNTG
ncbi:MAG: hypothetical protein LUC93_00690, partial [Planctomycetaceae bacterium]|nr:hypothetical protein [Planctomycetaceae bacterium]